MGAFGGDTHALIPMYAVGVFVSFTISQIGMVVHWREERGPRWRAKLLLNGTGMVLTAGGSRGRPVEGTHGT